MSKQVSQGILTMMLPFYDEAPITNCPHCGEEFNTSIDECEPHFETIDDEKGIHRHRKCGGVVKMIQSIDA